VQISGVTGTDGFGLCFAIRTIPRIVCLTASACVGGGCPKAAACRRQRQVAGVPDVPEDAAPAPRFGRPLHRVAIRPLRPAPVGGPAA